MIFDCVVCSTIQNFGDLGPLVTDLTMADEKDPLLVLGPGVLFNFGVQVVVPSLTALLADSSLEVGSDLGPFLGALLLDKQKNFAIFFLCPGAFHKARVEHFLPPMEALDISSAR